MSNLVARERCDVSTGKMADLFAKYNCTYCQEDIAGLRIKCAECADFDLCLQCFSAGAEIGNHKNDHPYQFMDSGSIGVCLGRGGWSAREELHLLDAIEQYGFGNWEDISRHIETRTPEEAKEEYVARFLDGNIGQLTWPAAANSRPKLTDHTSTDSGPLSPDITSRLPPLDATREEATLLGYMPQRDDFEREYDNGAEALVSPLYVNNVEDDDLDINLKLAQVDMFTRRLRVRASRKRVARDYQLMSQFFSATRRDRPTTQRKNAKEQRELSERLRAFTRFHTAQEHEQFVQGLVQKQELTFRLSELMRYRRNGLTTKEECIHFEQERLQHDHWKEKKSGSSGSSLISQQMDQRELRNGAVKSEGCSSPVSPRWGRARSSDPSSRDSTGERMVRLGGDAPSPTELSSNPAYKLLSPNEIKLCESLQLKPIQYVTWKSVLIKDHQQNGIRIEDLYSGDAVSSPERRILDYLVSSGWIAVS